MVQTNNTTQTRCGVFLASRSLQMQSNTFIDIFLIETKIKKTKLRNKIVNYNLCLIRYPNSVIIIIFLFCWSFMNHCKLSKKSIPVHGVFERVITLFFFVVSICLSTYTDLRLFLILLFHCQIVNFTTPKTSTPTVIVSASYLNTVPQQNSIATWVEVCKCGNLHNFQKLSRRILAINTKF